MTADRRSRLARRPERLRVVVDLERRHRLRERDPGQLRPREDVDVGRDLRRVVERAAADESHLRPAVQAVDRDLAGGAPEDALGRAVVAGHVDRLRVARDELDPVGLDQQVDHEGASRLPLAAQAVAAVGEQRLGGEPVAHRAAGAAAFSRMTTSVGAYRRHAGLDVQRAERGRQRPVRGAGADEHRAGRVDAVRPRERERKARKRRPAPAARRPGGVRAERGLDRPRDHRGKTAGGAVERGAVAVRVPVEDQVRRVRRWSRRGRAPSRRDGAPPPRRTRPPPFVPGSARARTPAVRRSRSPRHPQAARARERCASATSA